MTNPEPNNDKLTLPKMNDSNENILSVFRHGIIYEGKISGSGDIRIDGVFDGQIALQGVLFIGESGRVTCQNLRANRVIVAGTVRGNITTQALEIRGTGRIWGDVTTIAFVTEDGAFLRGQIRMEENVELDLVTEPVETSQFDVENELAIDVSEFSDKLAGDTTTDAPPPDGRKRKTRKGK